MPGEFPRASLNRQKEGDAKVRIEYVGHACLRCIADSGEMLIMDPPAEKYGYILKNRQADYITTSHEHEDHNAVYLFPNATIIPQVSAQMQAGPFSIAEMDSFHDNEQGALRGENRIYQIKADGVTLVHMGDIGHPLSKEFQKFAEGADVLAIPVGGCFTVEPEQVVKMIAQLSPRYILPIHYKTAQCTLKQLAPLETFLAIWRGDIEKKNGISLELMPVQKSQSAQSMVVLLDYETREKDND